MFLVYEDVRASTLNSELYWECLSAASLYGAEIQHLDGDTERAMQFIIEVLVMKWRDDAPQVADCWWSRSPAAASWSVLRCGVGGAGEDTECLLRRRRQGPGRGGAAPERLRVLPRWSVIMTSPHWLQLPHFKSASTHVLVPNSTFTRILPFPVSSSSVCTFVICFSVAEKIYTNDIFH